jgi:uncharacterized protein with GYD domain
MAKFVMLTTLTDEGRKTITENPGRIKEVNKEVEAMGAKILAQYAVLGPYDFVNIVEAPNNEAVSKVAIALGSRGTLQTMTLAAMDMDAFIGSLKKQKGSPKMQKASSRKRR